MALNTGKRIVRRSWDVIPMPDTVITRVNALDIDQPEQLIFTDRRGRPIGDVKIPRVDPSDAEHIEIQGVDASDIDVDNIEIPRLDTDIPPTDPAPIEPSAVHQADAAVELMPAIQQVEPELRRSIRIRTQMENYIPSMSGSK